MKGLLVPTLAVALAALFLPWMPLAGPSGGPIRFEIDDSRSVLYVVTGRAGALGFLGHEHAILATEMSGDVCFEPGNPAGGRGTVTVPIASLRIDSDRARELADLGSGPDADTVQDLQKKMLSAENLAAEQHPAVRFETTSVRPRQGGTLEVEGRLTVRGRAQAVRFPVEVASLSGGAFRLEGSFEVKQTSFGIEPETVAGVVKVADPVDVRFRLLLASTGETCSP